jgi:hypothetical protein
MSGEAINPSGGAAAELEQTRKAARRNAAVYHDFLMI